MVKIMKIFLFSSSGFLSVQLAFLSNLHSQLFVNSFVQPVWISRTNGIRPLYIPPYHFVKNEKACISLPKNFWSIVWPETFFIQWLWPCRLARKQHAGYDLNMVKQAKYYYLKFLLKILQSLNSQSSWSLICAKASHFFLRLNFTCAL